MELLTNEQSAATDRGQWHARRHRTTFDTSSGSVEQILVNPGGIIAPTGSTFSLPLYVPYNDVATLAAGNNQSFDQIGIDAGTISSGSSISTRSAPTRQT